MSHVSYAMHYNSLYTYEGAMSDTHICYVTHMNEAYAMHYNSLFTYEGGMSDMQCTVTHSVLKKVGRHRGGHGQAHCSVQG